MSYIRVGSYIMSNDFERFWELLGTRLPVLVTSVKDDYVIRQTVKSRMSRDRWTAMRRFESDGMWFIDPEFQYNPEYERKVPNLDSSDAIFTIIPDSGRFARMRKCWESIVDDFDRKTRCIIGAG